MISINHQLFFFDAKSFKDYDLDEFINSFINCKNVTIKYNEPEHELLKPLFNWMPLEIIKKTFQLSTQCTRTFTSYVTKKMYHSPFPTLNIKRRSESVATYEIHCDAPAIDDGFKCTQDFVGTKTLLTDVYRMKSDKKIVSSLEDNIR